MDHVFILGTNTHVGWMSTTFNLQRELLTLNSETLRRLGWHLRPRMVLSRCGRSPRGGWSILWVGILRA